MTSMMDSGRPNWARIVINISRLTAIGIIDGGSGNNRNGIPFGINSFSVRFLVDQACNTPT